MIATIRVSVFSSALLLVPAALSASPGLSICAGQQLVGYRDMPEAVLTGLGRCLAQSLAEREITCDLLTGFERLVADDRSGAVLQLEAALEQSRRASDPFGEWLVHFLLATSLDLEIDGSTVEDHLRSGLAALERVTRVDAPPSSASLVFLARMLDVPEEMIEQLPEHRRFFAFKAWHFAAAMTHDFLGLTLGLQRDFDRAEEHFSQALALGGMVPEMLDRGMVHEHLGKVRLLQNRLRGAAGPIRRAVEGAIEDGDLRRASELAERFSRDSARAGELSRALESNLGAIALAHEEPARQAVLWLERAVLLALSGRSSDIKPAIEAGLGLASMLEQPYSREKLLFSSGDALFKARAVEEAIFFLERLVHELEPRFAGDETARRLTLGARNLLVQAYWHLGHVELSHIESAELAEQVRAWWPDSRGSWSNYFEKSPLDADFKQLSEAVGHLDKAGPAAGQLTEWVEILGLMQELIEAKSMAQAKPLMEALQQKLAVIGPDMPIAGQLAGLLESFIAGHLDAAERHMVDYATFLNQYHRSPRSASGVYLGMALVHWQDRDVGRAAPAIREAVRLFESSLATVQSDHAIRALVEELDPQLYPLAVDILGAEEVLEAFEYAERGRGISLRRLLGSARLPRLDLNRRDAFTWQAEMLRLESLLQVAAEAGERERLEKEIVELREGFEQRRLQRQLLEPSAVPLELVEPIRLRQLQDRAIEADTTLLYYFRGLDGLWTWAVGRDHLDQAAARMSESEWRRVACLTESLRWQRAPSSARERSVGRGAALISDCEGDEEDPGKALYRLLIEPLEDAIEGRRKLTIVPHGLLHHLPFAALENPESGRYLAQDFVLSLAPSASALPQLAGRLSAGEGGQVLVLGDPASFESPLAGARREAKRVAELFGVEPKLGGDASEVAIKQAGGVGLLHIAAHGRYTPEHPIFSRLVLAAGGGHDGMLEMHEVWDQLDLRDARLVTLSGCETALGELTAGDEVIGLTQAFLVAGSRAVVSTLWPVDDEASSVLMARFYVELIEGREAAAALREAQLAMLEDPRYRAPYFWAGYTLTGDGTTTW